MTLLLCVNVALRKDIQWGPDSIMTTSDEALSEAGRSIQVKEYSTQACLKLARPLASLTWLITCSHAGRPAGFLVDGCGWKLYSKVPLLSCVAVNRLLIASIANVFFSLLSCTVCFFCYMPCYCLIWLLSSYSYTFIHSHTVCIECVHRWYLIIHA